MDTHIQAAGGLFTAAWEWQPLNFKSLRMRNMQEEENSFKENLI